MQPAIVMTVVILILVGSLAALFGQRAAGEVGTQPARRWPFAAFGAAAAGVAIFVLAMYV